MMMQMVRWNLQKGMLSTAVHGGQKVAPNLKHTSSVAVEWLRHKILQYSIVMSEGS